MQGFAEEYSRRFVCKKLHATFVPCLPSLSGIFLEWATHLTGLGVRVNSGGVFEFAEAQRVFRRNEEPARLQPKDLRWPHLWDSLMLLNTRRLGMAASKGE
jgi:hypothetical protein